MKICLSGVKYFGCFAAIMVACLLLTGFLFMIPGDEGPADEFEAVGDVHVIWDESAATAGGGTVTAFTLADVGRDGYAAEAVVGNDMGRISLYEYDRTTDAWGAEEVINTGMGGSVLDIAVAPMGMTGKASVFWLCNDATESRAKVATYGTSWSIVDISITPGAADGMAVGDLTPMTDGVEVVLVSADNNIEVFAYKGGAWNATQMDGPAADDATGTWGPVAIGDFDYSNPGYEAAVVFYPTGGGTKVYELYDDAGTYATKEVGTISGTVNYMSVMDADSANDGNEILMAGESAYLLKASGAQADGSGTATFGSVTLMDGAYDFVTATCGDVDPTKVGKEIVLGNMSGDCYILTGSGASYTNEEMREAGSDIVGVGIGDLSIATGGREVAVCGADGALSLVEISPWVNTVMAEDPEKMDGVCVGDLDPAHDGNEVVFCGLSGNVGLTWWNDVTEQWNTQILWTHVGELLTPIIVDMRPDAVHAGNELYMCGMIEGEESDTGKGVVVEIYKDGSNWNTEIIYETDGMGHGITVYDLDPTIDGKEIYVVGFDQNVTQIYYNGTDWVGNVLFTNDGKLKKIEVGEFDASNSGAEAIIVGGVNATEFYHDGTDWVFQTIYTDEKGAAPKAGIARVAVGDILSTNAGGEVVVGTDSWKTVVIYGSGTTWDYEVVMTESPSAVASNPKNRGVWIGDLNPDNPGNEIISCGYSYKAHICWKTGSTWNSYEIWDAPGRLHEARIGDFDPTHPGVEAVTGGYGSTAKGIVAPMMMHAYYSFDAPTYTLNATRLDAGTLTVDPETTGTAMVYIDAPDDVEVHVAATGLPAFADVSISPAVLYGGGVVTINVDTTDESMVANGTLAVTVTLNGHAVSESMDISVNLEAEKVAPTVLTTDPVDGATDILYESVVTITFSEPLDASTVTMSNFIISDSKGEAYEGDIAYTAGTNEVTISNLREIGDPDDDGGFDKGRTVTIVVSKSITDEAGNEMAADHTFSFDIEEAEEDSTAKDWILGIIVLALIIVLVVAAVVFFMRSKKPEDEDWGDDEEEEKEEDPIESEDSSDLSGRDPQGEEEEPEEKPKKKGKSKPKKLDEKEDKPKSKKGKGKKKGSKK